MSMITNPLVEEKGGQPLTLKPVLGFKRYTVGRCDISPGTVVELLPGARISRKIGDATIEGVTYFEVTDLALGAHSWTWICYPIAETRDGVLYPTPCSDGTRFWEARNICGLKVDRHSELTVVGATAEDFLAVLKAEEVSHAA